MSEENNVVEPQVEFVEEAQEARPASVEDDARAQGWVPKSEFKGDPKDWRSAEVFVERGPLMKHIKELNRKMESLVTLSEQTSQRAKAAEIVGYKKAVADMKAARTEALEMGDTLRADKLTDTIAQTQSYVQAVEAQASQPSIPVEVQNFIEKHKDTWLNYNSPLNCAMTNFAMTYEQQIREQNPGISWAEVGEIVEAAVVESFPQAFPKKHTSSPPPTTSPRKTERMNTSGVSTIHDLPAEARQVYNTVAEIKKKHGQSYSVKQFLETYRSFEEREND